MWFAQFLIDQADAQEAIAALMPSGPSSADAAESYESNAQALDELERLYCSDDGRALSDDAPTVARQASFATRLELKRSLRTLQSKLALYGLQAFEPPEGLTLDDLDTAYRAREDELWKVRTALVDSLYDARLAAAKRQRRALDEVRASVEEAQREIFDIQGALEVRRFTTTALRLLTPARELCTGPSCRAGSGQHERTREATCRAGRG